MSNKDTILQNLCHAVEWLSSKQHAFDSHTAEDACEFILDHLGTCAAYYSYVCKTDPEFGARSRQEAAIRDTCELYVEVQRRKLVWIDELIAEAEEKGI